MNDLTSILKELFQNGQTWVILPIIVVIIAFNLSKIYLFLFEVVKETKLNDIKLASDINSFDEVTKSFLNDYLEKEYFKIATNINWEKKLRLEVLEICSTSNNNLNFDKFKTSKRHIKYLNSKVSINLKIIDKVSMIFNLILGSVFLFFGSKYVYFFITT